MGAAPTRTYAGAAMGRPALSDERAQRKRRGAWYTPDVLVDHLVSVALDDFAVPADRPLEVLDPSCGDGAFLAGVRRVLGSRARLTGVDVDPGAVAAARAALPGAEIVEADALGRDWGERRFDLVVGNPPFLNQLARATTRGGRSRYGGGPYADAAAEFLALSVALARADGGRVCLVLPQSLLTARDAGSVRAGVAGSAALRHLWHSTAPVFDAAVHTCALVAERGATQGPVTRSVGLGFERRVPVPLGRSWGALLLGDGGADPVDAGTGATLGDIAAFTVDFRDQYYGLVGAVGDDVDGPPLITSGLIDPGRCQWGERPVRFAKQTFAAPRVDLDRLSPALQGWARRRLVPKILIANQTRVVEAVVDRAGAWLPSVPVITCTTPELDRVAAVLGSAEATAWVRHHAAGSGLSVSSVRLTPSLLASIPLSPG